MFKNTGLHYQWDSCRRRRRRRGHRRQRQVESSRHLTLSGRRWNARVSV
jgi:hypothetical protein